MLAQSLIEDVLAAALTTGGDFSELFVEDRYTNQIDMQGGKVEHSLSGRDYGVGIRVFKGFESAYAYTTDSSRTSLMRAAEQAAHAIRGKEAIQPAQLTKEQAASVHPVILDPTMVEPKRKVDVMRRASEIAQTYHARIQQVLVKYMDEVQHVLIANSEGKQIEDRRVRSRLVILAIAADGQRMERGAYGPGAHQGFEFIEGLDLDYYTREAARIAVTMLDAEPCPSGKFPVIIDNEFGGVIFHEACGHGLEATAVAKKQSVFADRLGERVAPEIVTYIDDGTIENAWGSIVVDDEGEPARRNVLIENGILKGYLIDKLNGRRMGMAPTGSARRQSYRFAPTSRMTNTYIAPGESTPESIIANTEKGIYAKYMGGGQVDPATGDYNFTAMEAYLVENGKIKKPLKGATLIGNGPETLRRVDMVGNNLAQGPGICGSISGMIPVNVGQPMLRVREMTVGGTRGEE